MRRKIIAGNWKMNGGFAFMQSYISEFTDSLSEKGLLNSTDLRVILAPPAILLSEMKQGLENSGIDISAQNVSAYLSGAYTGEMSSSMLAELECGWSLVGHSERRALFGETDEVVLEKVKCLLERSVSPILCVGESLSQRENHEAELVVGRQIEAVFGNLSVEQLKTIVIAYEPVWAIGTGKTATPEQAQEMHEYIRRTVAKKSTALAESIEILYGGSVSASNSKALFNKKDIDGGLVGGASLKVNDFLLICEHLSASE